MAKSQKTLNVGKIGIYDEEKVFFFSEKKRSIFLKAFFTKIGGAKYAAGRWPSCLFSHYCLKSFLGFQISIVRSQTRNLKSVEKQE